MDRACSMRSIALFRASKRPVPARNRKVPKMAINPLI